MQASPLFQIDDLKGLADIVFSQSAEKIILVIALFVLLYAVRMLAAQNKTASESQKASDEQASKALDTVIASINKIDMLAASLDNMAAAQRESAKLNSSATEKLATTQAETINQVFKQLATMDEKRSEEQTFANTYLERRITDALTNYNEQTGALIGTILHEARLLHEQTRRAIAERRATGEHAAVATPDKSPEET